jgi:hypothetical protein
MSFGAQYECECRKTEECVDNHLPSFSDPSLELDLVPGEARSFTVEVTDSDENLDQIVYVLNSNLHVKRVSHTIDGEIGWARFTVSYQGEELLETHLEIEAWDKCNGVKPLSIAIHIYHPPKLSLRDAHWDERSSAYVVCFTVDDPDLDRCNQGGWENIELDITGVRGGEVDCSHWGVGGGPGCAQFPDIRNRLLYFYPSPGGNCNSGFTIIATDFRGQKDSLRVTVPNRDPVAKDDQIEIKADAGSVTIDVLANDEDPDDPQKEHLKVTFVSPAMGGETKMSNDRKTITFALNDKFLGYTRFSYNISDQCGASASASVIINRISPPLSIAPSHKESIHTVCTYNAGDVLVLDPTWAHQGCFKVTHSGGPVTVYVVPSSAFSFGIPGISASPISANELSVALTYEIPSKETLRAHREDPIDESFTLVAQDLATNETVEAELDVIIRVLNQDPTAVADAITIEGADPVFITVLDNDSDPDGDELSIVSVGSSSHGTVAVAGDRIRYTPLSSGVDIFTYTISDGYGGEATATVTVTIFLDTIPPNAICRSITVALDGVGQMTITPTDVDGGSTDNYGIADRRIDRNTFTCADLGANPVVLTVEDYGGNTDSCTATVTVVDAIPPTAVGQDITVYLDASGQAAITAADIDDGSTDNCGIISRSASKNVFTCADLGANAIVLTVEDESGNASQCAATVTVLDNRPPTMTCPANITTEVDPGRCTATNVNLSTPTVNDNCGVASVTNDAPAQFPVGTTWVTWTVIDTSENEATCTQWVTVEESVPPVVNCPGNITTETTDPSGKVVTFAASATDNCDPSPSVSCSPPSGTRFPIGTTTVTCTATDASGNQDTCQFTVMVNLSNRPPIARSDSATTQEDTTVWIPVLNNDSDPDGDPFSVASVGSPWDGMAWESGGGINYRPDPGFSGTDSFTYTIKDIHDATSNVATVAVTVEHVNRPPVAYDAKYMVWDWSNPVSVHLEADDPDGDPLTYIVGSPHHGFLRGTPPDLTYTHTGGGVTEDWFTFKVFDGQEYSNVATVVIDPPVGEP